MSSIDEFLSYCNHKLNENIGYRSKSIIEKARLKIELNDQSNLRDFEEFINLIELDVRVISGKNNAVIICNDFRSKAIELNISKQAKDIFNSLMTETSELSISEFLKKINVSDACTLFIKERDKAGTPKLHNTSVRKKIDDFLKKHTFPTEAVINRFSTYLAYKFCMDIRTIKSDIIKKVRIHVKNSLINRVLQTETRNFIKLFPQPGSNDINDFIKHIHMTGLNFNEDELRQQILDEILYRKFHVSDDIEETHELSHFLDIIKTCNNKKEIMKEMHRAGIIYLIENGSGISDKLLDEYINLIALIDRHIHR